MKRHVVEIKGHKFHIIVDGLCYKIFPDGKRWYSSALSKGDALETAIRDIKENFLFYIA